MIEGLDHGSAGAGKIGVRSCQAWRGRFVAPAQMNSPGLMPYQVALPRTDSPVTTELACTVSPFDFNSTGAESVLGWLRAVVDVTMPTGIAAASAAPGTAAGTGAAVTAARYVRINSHRRRRH